MLTAILLSFFLQNLDSPSYQMREFATKGLDQAGFVVVPQLIEILKTSSNPEVQWRVEQILNHRYTDLCMIRRDFPLWEAVSFYFQDDLVVSEKESQRIMKNKELTEYIVQIAKWRGLIVNSNDAQYIERMLQASEEDEITENASYSFCFTMLRCRNANIKHPWDTNWTPRK
jgi:hypothetical protein